MKQYLIHMKKDHTISGMAEAIHFYLTNTEHMESRILTMNDTTCVVQAKEPADWKKLIGMDRAIIVKISPFSSEAVQIEIGEGKWTDKALAATLSWFVLWPLAVTSAVGSIRQLQLPDNILMSAQIYANK